MTQVNDSEFRELVDAVCTRPGMWVHPPDAESVLTFVCGFDNARNGGPLNGFHEWLVVRENDGNNLHWTALALLALASIDAPPSSKDIDPRLPKLNALFAEFFDDRQENGVITIYDEYATWLRRQSWYKGPLHR